MVVLTPPVPLFPPGRLRLVPFSLGDFIPLDPRALVIQLTGPAYVHDSFQDISSAPGANANRDGGTTAPTPTAHEDGRRLDDLVDVPFRRLEGEDAWSTGIALAELPAVDRLLVVEKDDTPFDPASPQPTALASRVVYAEAIDRRS